MTPRVLAAAALAGGLALAGCGKQGPLERPPPLFGGPAGAPGRTEGAGPRPVDTVDRRDRDLGDALVSPPETPPAPGSEPAGR